MLGVLSYQATVNARRGHHARAGRVRVKFTSLT
jgi:hypothetical protein